MKFAILGIVGIFIAYFFYQQPRVRVNREFACVILLRGGYQSWGVNYSDGQTWDRNGNLITLWRRPYFYHNDIRRFRK